MSSAAVPFWRAAGMTYVTYSTSAPISLEMASRSPSNPKLLLVRGSITPSPNGPRENPRNPVRRRFHSLFLLSIITVNSRSHTPVRIRLIEIQGFWDLLILMFVSSRHRFVRCVRSDCGFILMRATFNRTMCVLMNLLT